MNACLNVGYQDVLIETYENRGELSAKRIRARPVRGQGLPTSLKVECSKRLREGHPVGSKFIITARLTDRLGGGKFLYTHYNADFKKVSDAEASKFLKSRAKEPSPGNRLPRKRKPTRRRTEKIAGTDLSSDGRRLLTLIIDHMRLNGFVPGDPRTYLGYKECCVALEVAPEDADLPWGRLLQRHGLNDLNEWTKRHDLPRVSGLIVNQSGDRMYWPGRDYFQSNGRPDMDGPWWEAQARAAAGFNWKPYVKKAGNGKRKGLSN